MEYKVYILWSVSIERFYVGSTNDLADRLHRHNAGEGKYTKKGIPWRLIWNGSCADRSEAVRLENKIKKRGIKRFLLDREINTEPEE